MDKLKKLKEQLKFMEDKLSLYKTLFLADGEISDNEQQKLDSLQKKVNQINEKIAQLEEEYSTLDGLYEEVIESKKRAVSNPTLDNKKAYQEYLKKFNEQYKSATKLVAKQWKKALEESTKELKEISAKVTKGESIKNRIDNFDNSQYGKVYCIVYGKTIDGKEWGRIDYVGANYAYKNSNKQTESYDTPLLINYFNYEDGNYNLVKKTASFATDFDKQLLDAFLKSGNTSYEQAKGLGRDYEYSPKNALPQGKGAWYLSMDKPASISRTEQSIEVPDWNDSGFQTFFDKHIEDCNKGILTTSASQALKQQMQEALNQQKELVQQLEQFHTNQNDQDENTAILIEVWKERITSSETRMKTELKGNCFKKANITIKPTNLEEALKEFDELCEAKILTKTHATELINTIKDKINAQKKSLKKLKDDKTTFISRFSSSALHSPDVKQEIDRFDKAINTLETDYNQNLSRVPSWSNDCIEKLELSIPFEKSGNAIKDKLSSKTQNKLDTLAEALKKYPSLSITIIGDADMAPFFQPSIYTEIELEEENTVETSYDPLDNYNAKDKSGNEIKAVNAADLPMMRATTIKDMLVKKGVNGTQITTKLGNIHSEMRITIEIN